MKECASHRTRGCISFSINAKIFFTLDHILFTRTKVEDAKNWTKNMRIIEPYCSMRTPELEKIAGIAKKGEGDEKEEKGDKEGDEAAAGEDKKTGEGGNQEGTGNNPTTNHGANHHGGANNHHHHHGHHGHHGNHHGHHGGNLPLTNCDNGGFLYNLLSNLLICV